MIGHRVLVLGYGSIGSRHARLLGEMGCDVAVVSPREIDFPQRHATLRQGWLIHRPTLVVVANVTTAHYSALAELAQLGHSGNVLVEKPIFDRAMPVPDNNFRLLRVAYNLRFHPVLTRLREELANQRLISAQAYVGQYLPSWRPLTDYRLCYSAHADQGGGALLDLSHDLDYLAWMMGPWRRVAALGGRMSTLEISSDDVFSLLYESDQCPVIGVQLNYLDRLGRRLLIVNTEEHTYGADLVRSSLKIDGEELHFPVDRDTTYRAMHSAMLSDNPMQSCTVQEALDTLSLCDTARDAAAGSYWRQR